MFVFVKHIYTYINIKQTSNVNKMCIESLYIDYNVDVTLLDGLKTSLASPRTPGKCFCPGFSGSDNLSFYPTGLLFKTLQLPYQSDQVLV